MINIRERSRSKDYNKYSPGLGNRLTKALLAVCSYLRVLHEQSGVMSQIYSQLNHGI